MTNYEKIKAMSIDEMAEFLQNKTCVDGCTVPTHIKCENCIDYLKQWLEQEENEKLKVNKGRCAFKCLDNTFCDEAKIKIDKLELDKDCLNASLETARKYRGIAETDRDNYKQALEEIKDIAKEAINSKDCYIYMYAGRMYCEPIFKKINEVLNDRD